MDSISIITNILQTSLQEVETQTHFSEKETFLKYFQHFIDCIQEQKLERIDSIVNGLNSKLKNRKIKEEKKREIFSEEREKLQKVSDFKRNVIMENCSLIVQQQQRHFELLKKEKDVHGHKILLNEKELRRRKMEQQEIITIEKEKYEKSRFCNLIEEKKQRIEWLKAKQMLSEILFKYDNEMLSQQNDIELMQKIKKSEEEELQYYIVTCASQEQAYVELMKEKEEYLEGEWQKKLYEIRLKFAKRTIVKFIEQNYPAWKKRKLKASKKKGRSKYLVRAILQKK